MKIKCFLLLMLSVCLYGCFTRDINEDIIPIYLLENQYTVGCYGTEIGLIFELNDVSYLVVDETILREKVANGDDLTRLCTSNVTNMNSLFVNNISFNQDISKWDTSNVTDTSYMFGAEANQEDYDSFEDYLVAMSRNGSSFNQDISKWDVRNVISMKDMFSFSKSFHSPAVIKPELGPLEPPPELPVSELNDSNVLDSELSESPSQDTKINNKMEIRK